MTTVPKRPAVGEKAYTQPHYMIKLKNCFKVVDQTKWVDFCAHVGIDPKQIDIEDDGEVEIVIDHMAAIDYGLSTN